MARSNASSPCSPVASKKRKWSAGESSPSRHAGERAYTRLVLPTAGVQLNMVPRHQMSPHVREAASLLDHNLFSKIISRSSAQSLFGSLRYTSPHELADDTEELPIGAKEAAERARKLWDKMSRFLGKTEPMWMDFCHKIFKTLRSSEDLEYLKEQIWDGETPPGLIEDDLHATTKPATDLAWGLRTGKAGREGLEQRVHELPVLSYAFVKHIISRYGLCASPTKEIEDLIYPSIIFECKTEVQPLATARNQVVGAAARSLAMLAELKTCWQDNVGQWDEALQCPEIPPVVIIICSGTLFQMMIAHGVPRGQAIDVKISEVWTCDIDKPESLFKLLFLVNRAEHFVSTIFKPWVVRILSGLRDNLSPDGSPEVYAEVTRMSSSARSGTDDRSSIDVNKGVFVER